MELTSTESSASHQPQELLHVKPPLDQNVPNIASFTDQEHLTKVKGNVKDHAD